jgi:chemotaxis protein CheD
MVEIIGIEQPPSLPQPLRGFEHVNRYWDAQMNLPAAKILPGECYVSTRGEMISTILGSCIAACIRDPVLGIGGMNHFMLPIQSGHLGIQRLNSVNPALCYGNWAMEFLINTILKQGGRKERLELKLFGGGRVLAGMTAMDIGRSNITFVLDFVKREGLTVKADDLGGDYPRKILYFPDTGAVKMRRIQSTNNKTVQERERAYFESMTKKPQIGGIELF